MAWLTISLINSAMLIVRPIERRGGKPIPNIQLSIGIPIQARGSSSVLSARRYALDCLDRVDNLIVASTSSVGPNTSDLLEVTIRVGSIR
jgi:hypothetical protein